MGEEIIGEDDLTDVSSAFDLSETDNDDIIDADADAGEVETDDNDVEDESSGSDEEGEEWGGIDDGEGEEWGGIDASVRTIFILFLECLCNDYRLSMRITKQC